MITKRSAQTQPGGFVATRVSNIVSQTGYEAAATVAI